MSWLLAVPFLILLGYSVFAAFKYTKMISNIFMGLVYKPSIDEIQSSRGEKISILDSSDQEIDAIHVRHPGSDRVLIFCHESGASKESWEKYAYFFSELGFHVLSVDFPENRTEDSENSLTQWPDTTEVEKLVTVIRWVKRAVSPRARVVLFGVSKGANLAFEASFREKSVEAVIADGLFSMKEIFRDYIRRWAPILVKPNLFGEHYPQWVVNIFSNLGYWHCQRRADRTFVDVEALLRKKHAPLLMIHGAEDDYVPSSHQTFLGKWKRGNTTRHLVVPHAGHNQAIVTSRRSYEDEVRNFLETVCR